MTFLGNVKELPNVSKFTKDMRSVYQRDRLLIILMLAKAIFNQNRESPSVSTNRWVGREIVVDIQIVHRILYVA